MPRVTVVIATRDRRDQVLFSLARLATVSGDPPVVLVDNGSADGTPQAVERAFPGVTVIRAGRNLGAAGRTLGVRAARTALVAFSDDDSWWGEDALDRAADHFARSPRLGVLAARMLVGPDEREDAVCREIADSPLPRRTDLPGPSILGFVACGAIVSRQAYLDAGGFSPVVFFLGEEEVFSQDVAAAGWGLAYVDDVVAHHWPRPGHERAGRRRLQARNALLSSWLRRPLSVALGDTVRLAMQAHAPELRGALLDAVRRLPAALAARRPLPPSVEADVRLLRKNRSRVASTAPPALLRLRARCADGLRAAKRQSASGYGYAPGPPGGCPPGPGGPPPGPPGGPPWKGDSW